MASAIDYGKINERVYKLIEQGVVNPNIGMAKKPVPAIIRDVNKHALSHGVTRTEAQGFIDDALVMFDQGGRSLYISSGGNAVLLDASNRLISAYKAEDFDFAILAILEVLTND